MREGYQIAAVHASRGKSHALSPPDALDERMTGFVAICYRRIDVPAGLKDSDAKAFRRGGWRSGCRNGDSDECDMMTKIDIGKPVAWRPPATILHLRSILCLIACDIAAVTLGFLMTWIVRADFIVTRTPFFVVALIPVYLVVAASVDAFSANSLRDPFFAIRKSWYALVVAVAILVIAAFYLRSTDGFSRTIVGLGSALAFTFVGIERWLLLPRLPRIVGGNPFSSALIRDGDAPIPSGEFSVSIDAGAEFDPNHHDPMMYDRLAIALAAMDRVVVTCPPERRPAWTRALRGANIQGEIYTPELARLHPLGMGPDLQAPSLIVAVGPLNLFDRTVKRVFDIVVAAVALIVFMPVMVMVALWVRLDSPGPILFTQTRIGRANRMFRMFKFRSMRAPDHGGDRSASREDDRITRCGRVIRRTSLDELPQLFNVLSGSMSIVGPRPHALGSRANDKLFWEVDDRYWGRHAAKPGLTGLAQIRGYRGATLVEDDLRNRVDADLEYLTSWTVWRDLKIIFLTVRVLWHRNAF